MVPRRRSRGNGRAGKTDRPRVATLLQLQAMVRSVWWCDRLAAWALALALLACAGPTASSGLPLAAPSSSPAEPSATASTVEEQAPDPAEALLATIDDLCAQERWDEALAHLTNAGGEFGQARELALRAELLRDCGRRHEALAAWQRFVQLYGLDRLGSRVVHELATLQRLEGQRDEAAATLQALLARQGQDAYVGLRADELRRQLASIRSGQPITHLSSRDLLGNLRGAPDPAERLRALRLLLDAGEQPAAAGAALSERAVVVALGDVDGAVRALAVASWSGDRADVPEFCAVAFADPFAAVRIAAIQPARRLSDAAARELLLAALAKESEPVVFAALHESLCSLLGVDDPLLGIVAASEEGRRLAVARWQERAGRQR